MIQLNSWLHGIILKHQDPYVVFCNFFFTIFRSCW